MVPKTEMQVSVVALQTAKWLSNMPDLAIEPKTWPQIIELGMFFFLSVTKMAKLLP